MKVLVTAGSTNVMIDKVRCISNIFKGKTGADIASHFSKAGNDVTLITSANIIPEAVKNVFKYKTYDDLYELMEMETTVGNYDVIIHSAAVSDYKVEGTYVERQTYQNFILDKIDSSKKISSSNKELFLKLVPTEKIIDKIRDPWGFKGILVKFKLQVGISDEELLTIAKKSRKDSDAEFIVANCLEWAKDRAYIVNDRDESMSSERILLAEDLLFLVTFRYSKNIGAFKSVDPS